MYKKICGKKIKGIPFWESRRFLPSTFDAGVGAKICTCVGYKSDNPTMPNSIVNIRMLSH